MRLVLLAATTSALIASVTVACSSSDASPIDGGTTEQPDGSDGEASTTVGDKEPGPPPADGGADTGAPADADVGDGSAAACQAGDTNESESNDTPETADPLSGIPSVYCGRLEAGDTDYATFTLNAAKFKSSFAYTTAPVTITATVEGQTFDLSGNGYVFMQGKPYVLKITAAAPTDYRLQLLP